MQKFRQNLFTGGVLLFLAFIFLQNKGFSQTGTANDSLTVNNIAATFNNDGLNFYSSTKSGMRAPKTTNLATIFSSSLWLGGYVNNNLKISANTYRQSGTDFFPGPLDTITGVTTLSQMNQWDQVWHIRKTEINDFLKNGVISASIANWPGNGASGTRESRRQAPFVDADHDGIYNPLKGDYPDMKGDEMLWWVNNDNGGTRTSTMGNALGVEINTSAFAFSSPADAINNTLFVDYKIINRSGARIDSFFAGIWTDFDIGYPFDDYVGSMTVENAYFGYNGNTADKWYGDNPPVQSVLFLKDSISHFIAYNNDANTVNGNPGFPNPKPMDYFNYLKGVWKNDSCMKFGGDGIKGTLCTNLLFNSDVKDSLIGWTEKSVGIKPGDRKCVGSIGPFSLPAGGVIDFPVAYVFARKQHGSIDSNIIVMKNYLDDIRKFYRQNFTGINTQIPHGDMFSIFPNPAGNAINILSGNASIEKFVFIDNMGRVCLTVPVSKGTLTNFIDLGTLPGGIYTIKAVSGKGQFVQKLIISK